MIYQGPYTFSIDHCLILAIPIVINIIDTTPTYVRMWFHHCHRFWYIGQMSFSADISVRASKLFSGTLNSIVIPNGPMMYASAPIKRYKLPDSLIFCIAVNAITEHKTGVPRNNTINMGLIILTFILCIANIPLSDGRSASAFMTKLENAKRSPVIKPAPNLIWKQQWWRWLTAHVTWVFSSLVILRLMVVRGRRVLILAALCSRRKCALPIFRFVECLNTLRASCNGFNFIASQWLAKPSLWLC